MLTLQIVVFRNNQKFMYFLIWEPEYHGQSMVVCSNIRNNNEVVNGEDISIFKQGNEALC